MRSGVGLRAARAALFGTALQRLGFEALEVAMRTRRTQSMGLRKDGWFGAAVAGLVAVQMPAYTWRHGECANELVFEGHGSVVERRKTST
jgi:hypothetical protein